MSKLKAIDRETATALMLIGVPITVPKEYWSRTGEYWDNICHGCFTFDAIKQRPGYYRTYRWHKTIHDCSELPSAWTEFYVEAPDETQTSDED